MLKKYKCHKEVRAAKIVAAKLHGLPLQYTLTLDNGFEVDVCAAKFLDDPEGGYYVKYEDGYESWSPAEAFEEGYTEI